MNAPLSWEFLQWHLSAVALHVGQILCTVMILTGVVLMLVPRGSSIETVEANRSALRQDRLS